jgi:hypothetical protein
MSWFSILPDSISFVETWAIRLFVCSLYPLYVEESCLYSVQVILGAIVISPWLLLIVYDIIYYAVRQITYDMPVIGGRARNRPRPRAPSLSERPNGRPRRFSLTVPGAAAVDEDGVELVDVAKKAEVEGPRRTTAGDKSTNGDLRDRRNGNVPVDA